MEADTLTKSVLKKSNSTTLPRGRKVTFSNTVKLFIGDENNSNDDTGDIQHLKYIEISIVDKSHDQIPINNSNNQYDDCNAEDFFVHKVIYDNTMIPDDDAEHEAQNDEVTYEPIIFDYQNEDDALDFVVHKVTDHEDNLILNDFDSDTETEVLNDANENKMLCSVVDHNNSTIESFSKLSIENILEHDKIIAYNDQNSLNAIDARTNALQLDKLIESRSKENDLIPPLIALSKKSEELVLSPPLQELSLEKIVQAHSDNILCELDISPLNSIQESDSESDVSSEDTMIMMTSEECQKNEQHIKQSFLQYQSIKDKKIPTNVFVEELPPYSNSEDDGERHKPESLENEISNQEDNFENVNDSDATTVIPIEAEVHLKSIKTSAQEDSSSFDHSMEVENKPEPIKNTRPLFVPNRKFSCPGDKSCDFSSFNGFNGAFRTSNDASCYWDKSLSSVQIPKDVRDWKIMLSSLNKDDHPCTTNQSIKVQCNDYDNNQERTPVISKSDNPPPVQKSDELEHFVHQSTERVERIRKRYHLSERAQLKFGIVKHSPLRGIRPRFGSTAEILQLMQKKNQPSMMSFDSTRNHMSWPCFDESSRKSQIESSAKEEKCSEHLCTSQMLSTEYPTQSLQNTYRDELLHSDICDHYSISSCPSILSHERGVPEGASPPRSLIEYGSEQAYSDSNELSDNVVYYSMKV